MSNFSSKFSFTLLFALLSLIGWGQVNMTTSGSINQDFNTLSNNTVATTWTDNSTITSWYSQRTGSGTTYQSGSGSSTTGNLYSFCLNTSATDKAIGSIGSGNATAGSFAHGVLLRNTSGAAITNLTVAYTGEQWRRENVAAQTITFWYRTSSSTISALNPNVNTGWTAVTALNFTSPQFSAAATALDGNLAANRTVISAVAIPSLSLANNDYIMLRWSDPDHTGSDHGLGIDDVTVSWTTSASSFSGVTAGAGSEPASISSLTTALTGAVSPQQNAVLNFDFTVTDDANTTSGNDALPTLISNIVIPQGTGNDVADWTQAIAGAQLSDGTNTLTGTVNAADITFASINTATLGNIADNATKTYSLRIWLNTSLGGTLPTTIDGLNLAFKIDRTNFTTASSATSTQFGSGAGTVVESGSTNNAVDVVATKLNFVVQPTNVNQNATMAPSVTISANDPNNNRDLNYTTAVSVSSTGTMTGSPLSAPTTAGLATVGAVVHTVAGSGLFLTGTSGSLTATGNSSAFNVVALNPLINVTGQAHSSTYAFGNVAWGSTLNQTFTINNTGTAIMNISSLTFGGSGFAIQGAAPTTVAIGGSANFTVRFTPNAIGAFTGSVTINNNSSNQTAYVINFTGTGTPSNLSTIIEDGAYSYTSNHAYLSLQAAGPLTSTSNSAGVFRFQVRDGGGTTDSDGLGTELNSITFSVGTTHINYIRTAALFDANTMRANTPTINIGAGTITFSGLSGVNFTATDGGILTLTLRVSYLTTVVDNAQIQYTISAATANAAGSVFASPNAGGAASSITGDRNRIEVIADRLAFGQGPSNSPNGASMSPSVTVRGIDVNNNVDLDFTGSVSVACSTPAALTSGGSATAVSGVATFGSIVHGTDGTYTMSASSSGLTSSSASSPYTITTVTFTTGDYRTNPAFSGTVFFGSTNPVSGISPWQSWNGSAWIDVTHSTGSPLSPQNLATKPGTIYVGGGSGVTYVDAAGGGTFNNIIVEFPVSTSTFYSGNSITGLRITTGNSLDIKQGTFYLDGLFELQGSSNLYVRSNSEMYITGVSSTTFSRNASSTFEVENDAYVQIDAYLPNFSTTGIWNGTEIFHPQSWFYFTDWSDANPLFTGTTISTTTQGSYSACFGHLTIDIPTTGLANNWTGVLPASTNVNLTHGDFEIYNDETDNVSLYSGNTSTVVVGGNLVIGGTGNVQFQTGAGILNFTVKGNVTKNGTGNFRLHTYGSASAGNDVIFNIDGNLTVNDGFFVLSTASASGTSETINLKGNLQKLLAGYMTQANSSGFANSSFNFTGTSTQTVDVILQNSNDMLRYRFFVKSGAYVQIIDQDWRFATDSRLTVEDGGTLDFGFNGTTALNLTETVTSATTLFALNQRGTLKITSPLGITAATSLTGNVQLDTRTYNQAATFWYIGKANQVTGNGITSGSSAKVVICDLANSSLELSLSNSTTMSSTTTVDATYGGHLYIKVGRFIESTSAFITSGSGTLRMEPNTYYFIPKGNLDLAAADADPVPRLSSAIHPQTQYFLNGGIIELAATGTNNFFQSLRGNTANPKIYKNVVYSGANTYDNVAKDATNYKNLTSAVVIDSSLTITGDAIVNCHGLSTTTPQTFTGDGGLIMSGTNSRFRIRKLNTSQPELNGINRLYSLTGGTVEFYGTSNIEQQKIRGNYGSPVKTIQYFNVDINAVAGNYTSGANAGNVDLNESFTVQGAVNVNAPAVLRMDAADFIYKFNGNTTNSVNINDGAGLYYGSPFGITTVAQGGTGLDPDFGAANASAGNIRTNNRSFSSLASYGFVSAGTMASGSGLPSNIVSLYVNRNNAGNLVNLTNSVTLSDTLKFQNAGVVVTGASNTIFVDNTSVDAVKGGAVSGTDKYVQGRLQRKINSGSTYSFPIGHSAQNAQGFSITPTGSSGSNILGFLEANSSSPLQARAYCDLETKTAAGQQLGQGTAGADGALDLVTFNLASPLQWDVTNPGGGITAYNITVNANGGQDINPVSAAGGTPVRYLMKNGEPGNTGVTTGTGGADYPSTGFLACPNGYTLTGMTSFSDFTLDGASQSNTGLPVKLTYFTARKEGETSVLNWMTSLEIDNDRFEVERKVNEDFEYIGKVNGSGNSTSPIRYQFVDEAPANACNYYRLKQVDFDGKFEYSNIVALYFDNKEEVSVSFYPNPVDNNIFISVNNKNVIQEAAIYNALGQEIRKIDIDSNNDVSDLASGTYLIKLQTGLQIITKQFVKF